MIRRIPLLLLCLLPLTPEAAPAAGTAGRIGVGVADFQGEGYRARALASAAHGAVEEELSRLPGVRLVERRRLGDLLDEIAFQQSGVTLSDDAVKAGRSANVQLLVFGDVSLTGSEPAQLALRVVDVASNRVLRVEQFPLPARSPAREQAIAQRARRLLLLAVGDHPGQQVPLAAGVLSMGGGPYPEEQPAHEVRLPAFRIDRTEVSRAAFAAWLDAAGRPVRTPEHPDLPAVNVSWADAVAYCASRGRRLPTEAEWERAARGPTGTTYPWGDAAPSPARARFGAAGPVAVDDLPAGAAAEGALHLAGNVAEWVADWYDPSYYARSPADDPTGPETGDYRVIRGGSFASAADELRGVARGFHNPLKGAAHIGFRCAEDAPAESTPNR
jgi:sulfatase modifying factor 1